MKLHYFLLLLISVFAAAQSEKLTPENIAGTYSQGSTAVIYVHPDFTFELIGYATFIPGKYSIVNNEIFFIPNIATHTFTVLGRNNKKLKSGIKLTFNTDFQNDGPTYISFDQESFRPVFAEDFSGGNANYTTIIKSRPEILKLGEDSHTDLYQYNTNTFQLDHNFNDYLLFYRKTKSAQQKFSGHIKTTDGKKILTSRWGDFKRQPGSGKDEMSEYIKEYRRDAPKNTNKSEFYYNDQLKSAKGYDSLSEDASIFDINQYIYDDNSNKYIRKDFYKSGTDYTDQVVEDYHHENIILRYNLLRPYKQEKINFSTQKIVGKALFNSDENSADSANEEHQ